MAPASRAADTNRGCEGRGLQSDVAVAVSLWASYCWQAIIYARLALASPVASLVSAGVGHCLSLMLGALLTAGLLSVARALQITFSQGLFPEPVRVGFLAGSGITVAVAESAALALNGPESLAVGAGSIALLLVFRHLGLRASAPLPVLALALAASAAFDLEGRGVQVVGSAPVAFAWAPLSALLDGRRLVSLMAGALLVIGLASALPLVAPERGLGRPRQGTALCASPRAQRAAAWAGVVSLLSLALSNVLGRLPLATISAILVVVGLGWIDARRLSELRRGSPREFRNALVAAFGVTIFGLRWGVAISVATALGDRLRSAVALRREVLTPGSSERHHPGFDARPSPVSDGISGYHRRRRGYGWVRPAWPPRRRAARRSGTGRDDATGAGGNRSRSTR